MGFEVLRTWRVSTTRIEKQLLQKKSPFDNTLDRFFQKNLDGLLIVFSRFCFTSELYFDLFFGLRCKFAVFLV